MIGYIKIKVQPGASKDELSGKHGDAVKIRLAARAVDGRANAALIAFLSDVLRIPRGNIQIRTGSSSRLKLVAVEGMGSEELASRLAARTVSG